MQSMIDSLQPLIDLFGDNPYMRALMALLIAFAVASFTALVFTRVICRIIDRYEVQIVEAVATSLRGPVYWSVILVGVLAAVTLLALPEKLTNVGQNGVVSCLIVIWSLFVIRVSQAVLRVVSARGREYSLIRPQTLPLFSNITVVFVVVLSIYFLFETWSVDMTAWLASAGIVGIAVGFAAKDTLANLFAGVLILADAPYKIGDYVVLDSGERGEVKHIGLRSTRILTRDDVEVTVPNSIMGNTRIFNESGGPHEKFRVPIQVGVAYGSDIDQVKQILMEIALQEPEVCQQPEPRVRFRRFGGSALEFELLCWVSKPEVRGRAVDALNSNIYKTFNAQNIEIPYSKHDVYIKQFPGSME